MSQFVAHSEQISEESRATADDATIARVERRQATEHAVRLTTLPRTQRIPSITPPSGVTSVAGGVGASPCGHSLIEKHQRERSII